MPMLLTSAHPLHPLHPLHSVDEFQAMARVMKAMGHASRLMMVEELSRGERCVCELTSLVGNDMSTVSRHLSVLKDAGIVEDIRRGKQIYYRLRVPCVLNFFSCVRAVLAGRG